MPPPTDSQTPGRCPSCQGRGQVGESCPERICALREYRYIPLAPEGDPEPSVSDDPVIGQRCGDYLLIGVLGSGGFGRVYRALQMPVGMPAAVKLLDMESGPAGMAQVKLAKFEIEAQALARMSHPNIVRLYQYGQHRGAPFLAMELVENANNLWAEIESRAAAGRTLSLDEVQTILMQVLAALEAAHERQIVHRDIKPENIMLQQVPGHGLFVKVLDFGLAKFTEDRTATSMLLGTPAYMAYEQLMRGPLGPWTDLYALGVLSYELMTGKRPYGGVGVQETLALKLDTSYDPWSRVAQLDFPDEVRVFVAHALARESQARYANATEFRAGLEHALNALRAGGDRFQTIPLGRIVEATVIPSIPVPDGILPDPTRRLARPKSEVEARDHSASNEASVPRPVATSPTGAVPSRVPELGRAPSVVVAPEGRPSRLLWLMAGLALAGVAVGVVMLTRTDVPTAIAIEDPPIIVTVPTPTPAAATAQPKVDTVRVEGATYARGTAPHDPSFRDDEDLQEVVLDRPLVIATTEVTQAQWALQFATRPSFHKDCGAQCPVEMVTWWDAIAYANAISEDEGRQRCYVVRGCKGTPGDGVYTCRDVRFEGLDCTGWRLPTEAEWEYVARAQSPPPTMDQHAVHTVATPHPVASRDKNAFGVHDIFGNVREWVHDAYGEYPPKNRVKDPLGPGGDGDRVIRGGGFRSDPTMLRAAARDHAPLMNREADLGFRLVRTGR